MLRPYSPEALTDFSREENRAAFASALDKVKAQIVGKSYPMIIDGQGRIGAATGRSR